MTTLQNTKEDGFEGSMRRKQKYATLTAFEMDMAFGFALDAKQAMGNRTFAIIQFANNVGSECFDTKFALSYIYMAITHNQSRDHFIAFVFL
ncbi:MAG: hypothetical protein AB7E47_12605 [Desulfovibrionaceae bacterium]